MNVSSYIRDGTARSAGKAARGRLQGRFEERLKGRLEERLKERQPA